MDACADITTIHIDRTILDRDRCLKLIQFEGRTTSYEMNMVLSAADRFYRKQFTKETATYNEWNKHANDICQEYTKRLLPAAKNQAHLKKIKLCAEKDDRKPQVESEILGFGAFYFCSSALYSCERICSFQPVVFKLRSGSA